MAASRFQYGLSEWVHSTKHALGKGVIHAVDSKGKVAARLAKKNEHPDSIIAHHLLTEDQEWRHDVRSDFRECVLPGENIDISGRHPETAEAIYYRPSLARLSVAEGSDGILVGHIDGVRSIYERQFFGPLRVNQEFWVPKQPPPGPVDLRYALPQTSTEDDVAVIYNRSDSFARVAITHPRVSEKTDPAVLHTIPADATKDTRTVFRRGASAWALETDHFDVLLASVSFSLQHYYRHIHERQTIKFGGSRQIADTTSLRTARTGFVWRVNSKSPVAGVTADGEKLVLPDVSDRSLGVRLETKKLDGTVISRSDLIIGGTPRARLALHASDNFAIEVSAKRATDGKIKLELKNPNNARTGDVGHDVSLVVYELRAVVTN